MHNSLANSLWKHPKHWRREKMKEQIHTLFQTIIMIVTIVSPLFPLLMQYYPVIMCSHHTERINWKGNNNKHHPPPPTPLPPKTTTTGCLVFVGMFILNKKRPQFNTVRNDKTSTKTYTFYGSLVLERILKLNRSLHYIIGAQKLNTQSCTHSFSSEH